MRERHPNLRALLLPASLDLCARRPRASDPGRHYARGSPSGQLSGVLPALTQQEKAELQLRQQEKQRIAGVVPNFNVSYNEDAAPLSPKQKLQLAFNSATDPVSFGVAAFDAGFSQAEGDFPGYGEGAQGYAKRFGASYVDNFDGTMLGNAIFPILLKQDPRYFRRGNGTFHYPFFVFNFDHSLVQKR